MTTTPELHELAKDPQAFDTALAALTDRMGAQMRAIAALTREMHELAGDKKSYRNTRVPVWGMSDLEAERYAQRHAAHGEVEFIRTLADRAGAQAILDAINFEIANMGAVYLRRPWTRFFPSVTKSQPHIHRSLSCSTLYPTTVMSWAPQLSGKTDEEAVAELDEALCSVCFPSAPVRLREYVSKRSQAEQEARQAEKDDRAQAKAAKQLTEAEQFRTVGHFGERVETVAKCRELVRKAPQVMAELEWTRANGSRVWTDPAALARVIRNREDSLAEAETNAATAETVLLAREARQEGYGANEADIAKMRVTALKNARKEWAKN